MPRIFQILHPGKEYKFPNKIPKILEQEDFKFYNSTTFEGIRFWNTYKNSHFRKLLNHKGKYVENLNEPEKEGCFYFMGEYEGNSQFKNERNEYVHQAFFSEELINEQNTDPYVFGEDFYYSICQKKGIYNKLNKGDIILFGSEKKNEKNVAHFYLDTLFVVNDKCDVTDIRFSKNYKESTIFRLGYNPCSKKNVPIHYAIKFKNKGANGIFSFVPSFLNINSIPNNYKRPKIDVEIEGIKIIKEPGSNQGKFISKEMDNKEIKFIWNSITQNILDQKFVLGTHLDDLVNLQNFPTSYKDLYVCK